MLNQALMRVFPCENSDSDGGIEWILLQCCQSSSELLEKQGGFCFRKAQSRVTFDLSKQSSVAAVKKHLREFLELNELALYFSDFSLENFGSLRTSSVVFGNLRKSSEMIESSESGRKLVDMLNKITLPFWRRFCFLLHKIYCYRAKKLTVYCYRGTPIQTLYSGKSQVLL